MGRVRRAVRGIGTRARASAAGGGKAAVRLAVAATLLALCSGCTEEETASGMEKAALVEWGGKRVDCSVPGLGVELPLTPVRADVTGDGTRDLIASFECVTGNASSFSHVVVLDGASPAAAPETVGVLLRMPASKDYEQALRTGAKIRKVSVKGSRITIVADKWRPMDAKACPSLTYVQVFTVGEARLSARKASVLEVPRCQ
ncbi:hypothetical protein [Streptomyces sp. NPDC057838]|uniref:hypothetical protein n=1 Tax=unclassified Streptomyces TaxID=2593676 RepID=UPI003695E5DA